ncbi:Eukaryotic elongation factor 2 kinase isoform 2 [Schistosoma japonicum]|uniref:Eukaryotic elongation factor 2 kinase isoform 2 n=1 Tax=Schistosoma japonicum TaxID=6182 RepID=A0A4Z2CYE1_SCHJA|nr:Eukaryotic elongation factor 2 kinase isoform 2 [Schistosoma japonicum]
MEEGHFGSSPTDLFPQALPVIFSGASGVKQERKLSVREIKIQRSEDCGVYAALARHSRAKALWRTAFSLISSRGDPWEKFHLQELPEEMARRYRYDAIKSKWIDDIVRVKVESLPFNRGAMRECFRAKKLSNFSHTSDWSYASNHVAKRYIEKVDAHVYFDDVRLQMDAKLWGEEYSRQPTVPKKVDISQMCVLEFINRPEKPLYHLEHFIEGTYRKYNSNSGFVDDLSRNTPQAFSHFTFERSGHRLIVVDIQGVGNLWTDPQIHTFNGKSYGDGNLGVRGMALFFYTHRCNPLCVALSLSAFDLPPNEELSAAFSNQLSLKTDNPAENINGISNNESINNELSGTLAIPVSRCNHCGIRRLVSENLDSSYRSQNNINAHNYNNDFVNSTDSVEFHSVPSAKLPFLPTKPSMLHHNMISKIDPINNHISNDVIPFTATTTNDSNNTFTSDNSTGNLVFGPMSLYNNSCDSGIAFDGPSYCGNVVKTQQSIASDLGYCDRVSSEFDQSSNSQLNFSETTQHLSKEAELIEFFRSHQAGHRSSSVAALRGADTVILGLIHHELARLHSSGRLALLHRTGRHNLKSSQLKKHNSTNIEQQINVNHLNELHPLENVNWQAVLFHEEQSATLGCLDAIQCLAQYYLNLMIDGPLSECPIKPDPSVSRAHGLALISAAASAGDRMAMVYLAEANYHGQYYSPDNNEEPDWSAAAHWYEMAAKVVDIPDAHAGDDDEDEFNQNNSYFIKRSRAGFDSLSEWPIYRLHGRLGEMYAKGGHGLIRDRVKACKLLFFFLKFCNITTL